jgi:hypothetical protein
MHPAARLIAQEEMDFVLSYDGNGNWYELTIYNDDGSIYDNLGLFMRGGDIDGNGKASCLSLKNAHHYTISNMTLHNGKKYGLYIGKEGRMYELVANNIYCKCNISGLKGNIGMCVNQADLHFIDCFVIDYTTGIQENAGNNRYMRCHIWGGIVPPIGVTSQEWSIFYGKNKEHYLQGVFTEEIEKSILDFGTPEMLIDSVSFEINSASNVLDTCYADTATIGYWIKGRTNVITCCRTYNNPLMGLRNTVAIKNESSFLTVCNSRFTNSTGTDRIYEGDRDAVVWTCNSGTDEVFAMETFKKHE